MAIVAKKSERGMILLLTILITAVLTATVVEYNYDANLNVDIAENYKNKMKASYLAKSGIRFVKVYLSSDLEGFIAEGFSDYKQLFYGKPIPVGSGFISITLKSEEGKINLNKIVSSEIVRDQFITLIEGLEIDASIYYSIVDWIDKDDDVFENAGAESLYYETLQNPYQCKNAKLESMEELRLIKGIDDEVYKKLKDNCTIYSNGLININEASKDVLMSLSEDMTEFDVNKIIEDRKEEGEYESIDELSYLGELYNDIKKKITTESKSYKITSVGIVDEISYKITNVVTKGKKSTKLLYSKEE
ncbi:type II secretion system minor pseudopilin GspK [Thermodesulfobacteriota bacterium]